MLFDSTGPVLIDVKRDADSAPELKVSVSRGKTTSVVMCK